MSASDILREQDAAYEESLRLDQMKDRLTSMQQAKFRKGEDVMYISTDGTASRATVLDVHYDDIPAYYTIRINGSYRSTLEEFLRPTPFDSESEVESDEDEVVRPTAEQLRQIRLRALQPALQPKPKRRDGIDPQNILVRRLRARG
tara:strand:- start:1698 stop:2135 length:438 start_codon:yes stop_codon:yes gene_type:complete